MAIVTFGSSKGGSGKSTLCVNLGVARKLAGSDLLLVDADPQQSLTQWSALRESNQVEPYLENVQRVGEGFGKSVLEVSRRYDTTLIDVAGHNSDELRAALNISNLVVLPLRPSNFDAWVFASDLRLLEQARIYNPGLIALVCFNGLSFAPAVRAREVRDMSEVLAAYSGFDIAQAAVGQRAAFNRSVALGRAVLEMPEDTTPSGERARNEIVGLYKEIFTRLGEST
jgi:chromosome partitioning protein